MLHRPLRNQAAAGRGCEPKRDVPARRVTQEQTLAGGCLEEVTPDLKNEKDSDRGDEAGVGWRRDQPSRQGDGSGGRGTAHRPPQGLAHTLMLPGDRLAECPSPPGC